MLRLYHLSDTLGARIEDPCNVPSDLDADQERTLKSPCPVTEDRPPVEMPRLPQERLELPLHLVAGVRTQEAEQLLPEGVIHPSPVVDAVSQGERGANVANREGVQIPQERRELDA